MIVKPKIAAGSLVKEEQELMVSTSGKEAVFLGNNTDTSPAFSTKMHIDRPLRKKVQHGFVTCIHLQ